MAAVSATAPHPISVLIDVDLGLERTGADPRQAAELAEFAIANGLCFRGLFGYEGHVQRLAPGNDKRRVCCEVLTKIVGVARQLRRQGIPVDIISTSGTGSAIYAAETPEITEIQAGSYLLMETGYEAAAPEFATALTVLATVISKTDGKRIVVDAGLKALSAERGMPTVRGDGRLTLRALHAEHGIIDISGPDVPVAVGDRLQINVQYGDATVNLHRRMFGVRSGIVTELLEIEA
jgi:D-serine deaminase-like pyridoxal phosphate-dependent protein